MNRDIYPPDWPTISRNARARAGNRCQFCGIENGAVGYRERGQFVKIFDAESDIDESADAYQLDGYKLITVVLTVAHLDHNPDNWAEENLNALCQRCHLVHDIDHHARNAANTRRRKKIEAGQLPLLL